jgi:hypothetical protein
VRDVDKNKNVGSIHSLAYSWTAKSVSSARWAMVLLTPIDYCSVGLIRVFRAIVIVAVVWHVLMLVVAWLLRHICMRIRYS